MPSTTISDVASRLLAHNRAIKTAKTTPRILPAKPPELSDNIQISSNARPRLRLLGGVVNHILSQRKNPSLLSSISQPTDWFRGFQERVFSATQTNLKPEQKLLGYLPGWNAKSLAQPKSNGFVLPNGVRPSASSESQIASSTGRLQDELPSVRLRAMNGAQVIQQHKENGILALEKIDRQNAEILKVKARAVLEQQILRLKQAENAQDSKHKRIFTSGIQILTEDINNPDVSHAALLKSVRTSEKEIKSFDKNTWLPLT